MKKWTTLDETECDGSRLTLSEQDGHFYIRVNGDELMSTRRHHSEEKLAELGCSGIRSKEKASVLIGGLGFGFTLQETLNQLRPDSEVVVAELLPAIVEWNKMLPLGPALADKRVRMEMKDVRDCLPPAAYDAILLDVDNGPEAFTRAANSHLYGDRGLKQLRAALKPGGCLAIWSAHASPPFEKQLTRIGFRVKTERARAHATAGGYHTIFLAYL